MFRRRTKPYISRNEERIREWINESVRKRTKKADKECKGIKGQKTAKIIRKRLWWFRYKNPIRRFNSKFHNKKHMKGWTKKHERIQSIYFRLDLQRISV